MIRDVYKKIDSVCVGPLVQYSQGSLTFLVNRIGFHIEIPVLGALSSAVRTSRRQNAAVLLVCDEGYLVVKRRAKAARVSTS